MNLQEINTKNKYYGCFYPSRYYKSGIVKITDFIIKASDSVQHVCVIDNFFDVKVSICIYIDKTLLVRFLLFFITNNLKYCCYLKESSIYIDAIFYSFDNILTTTLKQRFNEILIIHIQEIKYLYNMYLLPLLNTIMQHRNNNEYIYSCILNNVFFMRIGCSLKFFLQQIDMEIDMLLYSLIKLKLIMKANKFNIVVTGASDILDIKKDVNYVLCNVKQRFMFIMDFFYRNKLQDNGNILCQRLDRFLLKHQDLLCIYKYFTTELSLLHKLKIFYISEIGFNGACIRVLKLIRSVDKKIDILTQDIDSNIIMLINFIFMYSSDLKYIISMIIIYINNYSLVSVGKFQYQFFKHCVLYMI